MKIFFYRNAPSFLTVPHIKFFYDITITENGLLFHTGDKENSSIG